MLYASLVSCRRTCNATKIEDSRVVIYTPLYSINCATAAGMVFIPYLFPPRCTAKLRGGMTKQCREEPRRN